MSSASSASGHGARCSVFVSWAHRDPSWTDDEALAWQQTVTEFTGLLRLNGIEGEVDLYEQHNPEIDWTRYGPAMVENSDFTLIAISRAYKARWEGTNDPKEGAGAVAEANALKGMFQKDQANFQARVKLVVLPGASVSDIPAELMNLQRFTLTSIDELQIEDLVRTLTAQPSYPRPPLGVIPTLRPAQERGESTRSARKHRVCSRSGDRNNDRVGRSS